MQSQIQRSELRNLRRFFDWHFPSISLSELKLNCRFSRSSCKLPVKMNKSMQSRSQFNPADIEVSDSEEGSKTTVSVEMSVEWRILIRFRFFQLTNVPATIQNAEDDKQQTDMAPTRMSGFKSIVTGNPSKVDNRIQSATKIQSATTGKPHQQSWNASHATSISHRIGSISRWWSYHWSWFIGRHDRVHSSTDNESEAYWAKSDSRRRRHNQFARLPMRLSLYERSNR